MQTVHVVRRLPMKGMVNRFKSDNIYSLCGSFFPILPSLRIRWLFLTVFLIPPIPVNPFNPQHSLPAPLHFLHQSPPSLPLFLLLLCCLLFLLLFSFLLTHF